jgi:hypothetical protein
MTSTMITHETFLNKEVHMLLFPSVNYLWGNLPFRYQNRPNHTYKFLFAEPTSAFSILIVVLTIAISFAFLFILCFCHALAFLRFCRALALALPGAIHSRESLLVTYVRL